MPNITYPLDLSGLNSANLVTNEPHTAGGLNGMAFVLTDGPFFTTGLVITVQSDNTLLRANIDYKALEYIPDAGRASGKEVCAVILIINSAYTGVPLYCQYQAIGGSYQAYNTTIQTLINTLVLNGQQVNWANILNKPNQFPPTDHDQDVSTLYGLDELIAELEGLRQAILLGSQNVDAMIYAYVDNAIANRAATLTEVNASTDSFVAGLTSHISAAFGSPIAHTAAQVGLDQVSNWPVANDSEMELGTADLYASAAGVLFMINNVTATSIGLGNVDNTSDMNKPVSTAQQTALDGKVNITYMINVSGLATGAGEMNTGSMTIGVPAASNPEAIAGSISTKAIVPSSLAAVIATFTKSTVGLGNVDNTSDVNKPISSATSTALAGKVDNTVTVTGAGLATGGGALASNQTITVSIASGSDAVAGTRNDVAVTPLALASVVSAIDTAIGVAVAGCVSDAIGVTGAGLATGGGILTGSQVITVSIASSGDVTTGTRNDVAVTPLAMAGVTSAVAGVVSAVSGKVDNTTTVTGAGLATGGGALSSNEVITVTASTTAQAMTGTDTTTAMTPATVAAVTNALGIIAGTGHRVSGWNSGSTVTFAAWQFVVQIGSYPIAIPANFPSIALGELTGSIDLSMVGLNGMDTGSAPVSGVVAIYIVYNPTTNAYGCLATTVPPGEAIYNWYEGPVPVAGYTYSGLIAIWPTDGFGNPINGNLQGKTLAFEEYLLFTTTNTSPFDTTLSPITMTGFVNDTITNLCFIGGSIVTSDPTNSPTTGNCSLTLANDSVGVGAIDWQFGTGVANSAIGGTVPFRMGIANSAGNNIYARTYSSSGNGIYSIYVSSYTWY